MATTLDGWRAKLRSPMALKLFRYSMASVVAVIVSNVSLLIFVGLLKMGVVLASTLATTLATIPSYEMNRKWAWGKSGKSHLMKEVIPFWGLAIVGWAFSTWAVSVMDDYAKHHHFTHEAQTLSVAAVYLGAFGVLWVGKFLIFNSLMFVHHQPAEEVVELHADGGQDHAAAGTPAASPTPANGVPATARAANGTPARERPNNGTATNGAPTNGAVRGVSDALDTRLSR